MALGLSPELVQKALEYRRERNRTAVQEGAALVGAGAESMRTGESAPSVYSRWRPDYSQGMLSPEQKVAAMSKQADRAADIEKFRLEQHYKVLDREMDALEKQLAAAVQVRGQQSADSRARAQGARIALNSVREDLNREIKDARSLDEQSEALVKTVGSQLRDVKRNELLAEAAVLADPARETEAIALMQQRLPDVPPDRLVSAVRQMHGEDPAEIAEGLLDSGYDTSMSSSAQNAAQQALEYALRPGVPASQQAAMLEAIAAESGTTPGALLAGASEDVQGRGVAAMQQAGVELAARLQGKQQVMEQMVRQAQAVGADSSGVNNAMAALRAKAVELSAAPSAAGGSMSVQGPADDADALERIRASQGDALGNTVAMLDYIDQFPDRPPAAAMRQGLTEDPGYAQWKTSRGYDGFDDRLVFREFNRETRRAAKEQERAFEAQRDRNRMVLERKNAPRAMKGKPRTSDSANLVAGAETRGGRTDAER